VSGGNPKHIRGGRWSRFGRIQVSLVISDGYVGAESGSSAMLRAETEGAGLL